MNIKRIIKEELEGYKDSNEEDFEWAEEYTIEWTEELVLDALKNTHIVFKIVTNEGTSFSGMEYTMLLNDGSCRRHSKQPIIVRWDDGSDEPNHKGCTTYDIYAIVERLNNTNTPWKILNF